MQTKGVLTCMSHFQFMLKSGLSSFPGSPSDELKALSLL